MRLRRLVSIGSAVLCLVLVLVPSAALAQAPTPSGSNPAVDQNQPQFTKPGELKLEPGGICAPWHRCIAWGALGLAVLIGGALALGYFVQSKGFETIEHRQGNPEGVKVTKQ